MSDFHIRLYKDSDYDVVRNLFAQGLTEHIGTAFRRTLCLPHIWPVLLAMFLVPSQTTGSYVLSVTAVSISVAVLWLLNRHGYVMYVMECLGDDMMDIQRYYLERDGYCFWVAESEGEIVGIVAAVPPCPPTGGNHVELKRMSVPTRHRGRGIAKALCRTVIDYAQKRGCEGVVLWTSISQKNAANLYTNMGFQRTGFIYAPFLLAKMVDFRLVSFQLNFPAEG
ncbi:N-acetyltransferase 8-like [Hyperolius riggenbachi]|uniref:N-acetyltransferase 8-like n=1 Tax=Hyperolius riggenbachi TaxID=752182 RepID=UPI0035A32283